MNTFTPSSKSSFMAGIGLWLLAWAALFKADDLANLCGIQRRFSRDKCLHWIRGHKSTSLLITECVNFVSHGISDPLGVTFALGGTLVNVLMIFIAVPAFDRAKRQRKISALQF